MNAVTDLYEVIMSIVTLQDIKKNKKLMTLVDKSNECLDVLGYTDHGIRHVSYTSKIAGRVLENLQFPTRRVELAKIAGYVHDIGNMINRRQHSITGATMLFDELQKMDMEFNDVCDICAAVGSHDEETGKPVSDISAALIIADKVDAYKKRVQRIDLEDIHDRVNLAIYKTHVSVSLENKEIVYDIKMKDYATPMEFLEIYIKRMKMCEESASFLGCTFKLVIDGLVMNMPGTAVMDDGK